MVQGIFWVKVGGELQVARIEGGRFCLAIKVDPFEWNDTWYGIDAIEILDAYVVKSTEKTEARA